MSEVTLDELLEEVGISHKQLDETCTNEHLHDIALFLKSWRTLAPHLQLSSSEVEAIERDAIVRKREGKSSLNYGRPSSHSKQHTGY